jgi:hypothetical protein
MEGDDVVEIELHVMIDEDGNWQIGVDTEDLGTRWQDTVGDMVPVATRFLTVKIKVRKPKATVLQAEVPDEIITSELKIA